MPKILAVDFDNTLFHLNSFPDDSSVRFGNRIVHWYVRKKKRQGRKEEILSVLESATGWTGIPAAWWRQERR